MDCARVAGTEVIRHPRVGAFFDTRGQQSRIIGSVSCDTPALATIDKWRRAIARNLMLTDTAQF